VEKRRNIITPRIVRRLGVKTPPKVPNFLGWKSSGDIL